MIEVSKNKLNLIVDDINIGYILFAEKEDYIVGNHIYINPDKRGLGFTAPLIKRFVEMSKEKNKKIEPVCPVIKRILENKYREVLK